LNEINKFYDLEVKNWTKEEVIEWVKIVTFPFQNNEITNEIILYFYKSNVTGLEVLELKLNDLKKFIPDFSLRKYFNEEIEYLRVNNCKIFFNYRYFKSKNSNI
jgi:hypothetical protein